MTANLFGQPYKPPVKRGSNRPMFEMRSVSDGHVFERRVIYEYLELHGIQFAVFMYKKGDWRVGHPETGASFLVGRRSAEDAKQAAIEFAPTKSKAEFQGVIAQMKKLLASMGVFL